MQIDNAVLALTTGVCTELARTTFGLIDRCPLAPSRLIERLPDSHALVQWDFRDCTAFELVYTELVEDHQAQDIAFSRLGNGSLELVSHDFHVGTTSSGLWFHRLRYWRTAEMSLN